MHRRRLLIAAAGLMGAASFAHAGPPDLATAARLQVDRDSLQRRLDGVPADQLDRDPVATKTLEQLLYVDSQLAGTADDPLLTNEAIRAHRRHQLYLSTLAERAQRAKIAQVELRKKLNAEANKPAVIAADEKARAADATLADASAQSTNPAADYLKAIKGYEEALADLKSAVPPPPVVKVVNPLEGILVADNILCPTDAQLRTHAAALNGKPVRVKLKIAAMSRAFAEKGTTDFVTLDGKVRATMQWDQSPAEVKKAFAQRATTKAAMKVDDVVFITGVFRGLEAPEQCTIIVQSARK